jgi:hypothetical protein
MISFHNTPALILIEYIAPFSETTLNYSTPELQKLKNKQLEKELPEISLEYVRQDKDFRKDLMKYKQHISHQAPKTITTKIARMHAINNHQLRNNF